MSAESAGNMPQFQYKALQLDYLGREVPRAAPGTESEVMQQRITQVHQRIFETFPSQEDGINTTRVDNYFKKLGLVTVPHLMLWPEDALQLETMITDLNDVGVPPKAIDWHGTHMGSLGFCYVIRDRKVEELQGPEYSEVVLVHEKAHGTSRHNLVTSTDHTYWLLINNTPRTGFSVVRRRRGHVVGQSGQIFEEGFCEKIRADYMTNEMGLSNGFVREPGSFPSYEDAPAKYSVLAEDGPDLAPSSIAGYAMDLLCEFDPTLWQVALEARSDTVGLRSFARQVEAVQPGLYKRLAQKDYTYEGFLEGVRLVKAALPK